MHPLLKLYLLRARAVVHLTGGRLNPQNTARLLGYVNRLDDRITWQHSDPEIPQCV